MDNHLKTGDVSRTFRDKNSDFWPTSSTIATSEKSYCKLMACKLYGIIFINIMLSAVTAHHINICTVVIILKVSKNTSEITKKAIGEKTVET